MNLSNIVDYLNINKFALSIAGTGIFSFSRGICDESQWGLYGMCLGLVTIVSSVFPAVNQVARYTRLVHHLNEGGYDENACKLFMNWPCGRSIVKTALNRTGYYFRYNELKEKYPLTHFI